MDYVKKAIWGPDPKDQVCLYVFNHLLDDF